MAEVAEVAGVTAKTVKQWESGQIQPGIETAQKLAEAYGITGNAIMAAVSGQDPQPTPDPAPTPNPTPPNPDAHPADPLDAVINLLNKAGKDVTATDDAARALDRATRREIATLADMAGYPETVTSGTREPATMWILASWIYLDEWEDATASGLEAVADWAVAQYEEKIGYVDGDGDIDLDDLKAASGQLGVLAAGAGLGLMVAGPAGAAIGAFLTGVGQALFSDDGTDAEQITKAKLKLAPVLAALARNDSRAPHGMLTTQDPDGEE